MPELHWLGDAMPNAKRGAVWARMSAGRCIFLMATHASQTGKSVTEQIRNTINQS